MIRRANANDLATVFGRGAFGGADACTACRVAVERSDLLATSQIRKLQPLPEGFNTSVVLTVEFKWRMGKVRDQSNRGGACARGHVDRLTTSIRTWTEIGQPEGLLILDF